MESLTTTNVWLGILAVVSVLEFFMIVAAGVLAYQMYKRVMTTIETVERVHVAPLRARVDAILDEVQTVTDKVRHAQESVSDALRHVAGTGSVVAGAVRSKTWPIIGIIQGLKTAANTVMKNGKKSHRDTAYGPM
jgi:methyl-accepting chemotaxis protein